MARQGKKKYVVLVVVVVVNLLRGKFSMYCFIFTIITTIIIMITNKYVDRLID